MGTTLDEATLDVVARMSGLAQDDWSDADVERIREQPKPVGDNALPEKRAYGSNFPFADHGQLRGVRARGHVNNAVISSAYGGFSNVWGAQVMPFSSATFDAWPVSLEEMKPHYAVALSHIPFTGRHDDLAEEFPLLVEPAPLPPLAPRTHMTLAAYERHRDRLRSMGVTMGHARLAFDSPTCTPCGLCMTGCPRSLIYSASQSFDRFRREGRISYHPGLLATRIDETAEQATVDACEVGSGKAHRFTADRVFVACGGIGTTRLVLASLDEYGPGVTLGESGQFVLPMISRKPTPDPRDARDFTLNQFNMVIDLDGRGLDVSQVHFYPYNAAYSDALPGPLAHPAADPLAAALLRRLTVGLGYLPSWASPRLNARITPARSGEPLPELVISEVDGDGKGRRPPMLQAVLKRIWKAAGLIDLWPVTPQLIWSGGAKSYHFGGSFPHAADGAAGRPADPMVTDRMGRLGRWDRVHLVDGSVFPTVPATTFTLTVMANAHRIASESMASGVTASGATASGSDAG